MPRKPPADGEVGEINEMTLPSRHKIRNSNPVGLRPSTLPLGHRDTPQYSISDYVHLPSLPHWHYFSTHSLVYDYTIKLVRATSNKKYTFLRLMLIRTTSRPTHAFVTRMRQGYNFLKWSVTLIPATTRHSPNTGLMSY